jgi:hypothetical protein
MPPWWEERVDAVTQAVEAVTNAAQNAEIEAGKESACVRQQRLWFSGCRLPLRNLSCRVFAIAWNARIATFCISCPLAHIAMGLTSCQRCVALRESMRCIALAGEEARLGCGDGPR